MKNVKDFLEKNTADYREDLIESLRDPEEAAAYLKVALEEYEQDRDSEFFLKALRNVAEAQGGISVLAKKTHLNRQNLYRALSGKGNPTFITLETIMHALGFRLSIELLDAAAA